MRKIYYDESLKAEDIFGDDYPHRVDRNGPETKKGIVSNCLYLQMRKKPSPESETLGKTMGLLRRGDEVEVLGRVDSYYKIRVEGKVVYVAAEYVRCKGGIEYE